MATYLRLLSLSLFLSLSLPLLRDLSLSLFLSLSLLLLRDLSLWSPRPSLGGDLLLRRLRDDDLLLSSPQSPPLFFLKSTKEREMRTKSTSALFMWTMAFSADAAVLYVT